MAARILFKSRGWKGISCIGTPCTRLRSFAGFSPTVDEDDRHLCDNDSEIGNTLKHLGHRYWGYTIWRCTYSDDEAWSRFLTTLHKQIRKSLEDSYTIGLLDSFDCSVREDISTLDGASKELVRKRFREWASGPDAEAERESPNSQPIMIQGFAVNTRHNYCIHVDEDSLRSVLEGEHEVREGYVNVIKADWALPDPQVAEDMRSSMETEDLYDEGEEELEGCKMSDVGWMRVSVSSLVSSYENFQAGAWDEFYVRPPYVARMQSTVCC